MRYDVIVIGGGPGGTVAARELAHNGKTVAIIEDVAMGGTCLNRGCIPTKMLLGATAPLAHLHAHERLRVLKGNITVDYKSLQVRVSRFIKGSSSAIQKSIESAGIHFFNGKGFISSPNKVQCVSVDNTKELEAEYIIIACGSRSASFPGLEPDGVAVLDSTDMLNLAEVPESLLIIGAGAIGIELGDFFGALGTKITIIEAAPHIVPTEDTDIAKEMLKAQKKAGKECLEGVKASSLITKNGQAELTLGDGRVLTASKALVAVGRKPNTNALGAENTNCTLNPRAFIVTNEFLQAAPKVFAIGDINGKTLLAHASEHQGSYVARYILGAESKPYDSGFVPSCVYGSMEIMRVGKTAKELFREGKKVYVSQAPLSLNPIAQSTAGTIGFVKVVWDGDKIAGIAAIGHGVSHLVTVAQLLMERSSNPENLHEIMFAHPTLDEIIPMAICAPRIEFTE